MSSMQTTVPGPSLRGSQRPGRPSDRGDWGSNFLGPSRGLLVGGLVVAGLAYLAWRYIGPDLVRYIKIERM